MGGGNQQRAGVSAGRQPARESLSAPVGGRGLRRRSQPGSPPRRSTGAKTHGPTGLSTDRGAGFQRLTEIPDVMGRSFPRSSCRRPRSDAPTRRSQRGWNQGGVREAASRHTRESRRGRAAVVRAPGCGAGGARHVGGRPPVGPFDNGETATRIRRRNVARSRIPARG